jgi:translation initiation factor IF-2
MGNIRINVLARELEMKSHLILEYLAVLGVERKSHSSALDDEIADKVREHFRATGEAAGPAEPAPAPVPAPAPTTAPVVNKELPVSEAKRLPDIIKAELQHPLMRTLDEIKSAARRVVAPPPPRAVHVPVAPVIAPPAAPPAPVPPAPILKPAPMPAAPVVKPLPAPAPPVLKPVAPAPPTVVKPAPPPVAAPPTVPGPVVAAAAASGAPVASVPAPVAAMCAAPVAAVRPAPSPVPPTPAAGPVVRAGAAISTVPTGRVSPLAEVPPPPLKRPEFSHTVANAIAHGKPTRAARVVRRDPSSSQPIYPHAAKPKGAPVRPAMPRRPGEPRPMHPTSARPMPATASGAVATGGAPAARPPAPRSVMGHQRGPAYPPPPPPKPVPPEEVLITRKITITEGIAVKELSEKLEVRAKDVIKRLLDKGIFATINQTLDGQTAAEIARVFGAEANVVSYEEEILQEEQVADRPEDLEARAPVVTVMGHVDHGKTSLLDAIRQTNVAAHEAGGITQSIGAYQVEAQGRKLTFIDTPGHEAFTMMRARGARVTDVVVLVVAADDGVMPQTLEAINHARAAKVPIVVAVNKIDKADAQPERVKRQLTENGLMPEEWGGQTVTVEVSAKQHKNLDLLLEMILLVADLQQLKANPKRLAVGTVLEAKLDRGRGPVATLLVQNGTLQVGDSFIIGAIYGKVRAMFDYRGRPVIEVPPSTPTEVLGLEDVPQAGDRLQVIDDTLKARQIAFHRQAKQREAALAKSARLTLEQLHQQLAAGDVKELPLIIKADVQGSVEVLADTLNKLSTEKVKVKVIHAGVGAITETDVLLASASNAVVIGFNVRPERKATELAQLEQVDIRLHTIIYNVTDEIKKAMTGLLAVVFKETTLGRAEVRDTFRISSVGTVAGCYLQDGKITREAAIRLVRDSVVVYQGRIRSLRRFKDDVAEVRSGAECGIALENYNDVKVGDVIEAFVKERVPEPALA